MGCRPARLFALLQYWLISCASCLPADGRPEPGSLLLKAEPSEGTRNGFTTNDGWSIALDRFITALGGVEVDDPEGSENGCADYSETNYEWLFDFRAVDRAEKVGLVYGLGQCEVEWRHRGPSPDTRLGTGTSDRDLEEMRVEASDDYVDERPTTLRVIGQAEKNGLTMRFDWSFRAGFRVSECESLPSNEAGLVSRVTLSADVEQTMTVEVRAEELFRSTTEEEAPFLFDGIAAADLDQDGAITLEELALVPAPPQPEPTDPEQTEVPVESMSDLIYERLLPRVTRISGGGACTTERRGGPRN
jgi:hypothetical protein